MKKFNEYEKVSITADVVMLRIYDGKLQVLLTKRDNEPFKDTWSLPGGFVDVDKTLEDAIRTKVKDKTGYYDFYLEQLYTFDSIDRDPRGRVLSVAYLGLLNETSFSLSEKKNKETVWADFVPFKTEEGYDYMLFVGTEEIETLAFDHELILWQALNRIVNKIWYTNIVYKLLPDEFTLLDAKKIFEIFLCRVVNNFHRRVKDILEETGNIKSGQAYRPAKLFKVKEREND